MTWLARLDPSAAPLVEAAERLGDPAMFRGPEGARALAQRLLETPCETIEDERQLAESAGAALALLLLERHGGAVCRREDVLRVRLGRFGWLDPFGAVEAALDATDLRAALAGTLRAAEAEARGRGPVSRVLSHAETWLEAEAIGVQERFEALLVLDDGTTIDLRQAIEKTRTGSDDDARRATEGVLTLLRAAKDAPVLDWPSLKPTLVPRLVPQRFVEELASSGRGAIYSSPLGAPLDGPIGGPFATPEDAIALALLSLGDGRARFLRADEPSRLGLPPRDLERAALKNLAARSGQARLLVRVVDGVEIVHGETRDGLDAARALLPRLPTLLADALGGGPVSIAIPHRDTLLAARQDGLPVLQEQAREAAARAPHAISPRCFRLTSGLGLGPEPDASS